jgi:glycine cleavage system aminomethyltransferase T
MLNGAGCVEADVTVNKLADDSFVVVATDTAHRHVQTLLRRGIEDNVGSEAEKSGAEKSGAHSRAHAFVTDITGSLAQINIQGPNARRLMQACTDADMSDAAFPFRASREIAIGYALVNCVRLTYVGELGYELYVPAEQVRRKQRINQM